MILLNPVLGIVFATMFAFLWRREPQRTYVALLAILYGLSATGFLLHQAPLAGGLGRFLANMAFLGAASLMVVAMSWRYGRAAPVRLIGLVMVAAATGAAWFILVSPDFKASAYSLTAALGALLVLAAWQARGGWASGIDRALIILLAINGATMALRVAVLLRHHGEISPETMSHSPAWVAFVFSQSIMSLLIASTLALAVVNDVIADLSQSVCADVLSGLLNRRGFEEALAANAASRGPAALVLCDLDHFKEVNDTYGHQAGDAVIATFGRILREVVGPDHPIGRIGGEEFAILLTGANALVARTVALGVGAAFNNSPHPCLAGDSFGKLTASFGVAERRRTDSGADLLARADRALYAAKNAGRNRVHVHGQVHAPEPMWAVA